MIASTFWYRTYATVAIESQPTLTLLSVGAEPPLTSLGPEGNPIRSEIVPFLDDSQDLAVAMHSYVGLPRAAALSELTKSDRHREGRPGGVVALIHMAAWIRDEGQAICATGRRQGREARPFSEQRKVTCPRIVSHFSTCKADNVPGDYLTHFNPITAFYHDVDPDCTAVCNATQTSQSVPRAHSATKRSMEGLSQRHISYTRKTNQ